MTRNGFESVFAELMEQYVDEKVANGYTLRSFAGHLRKFDRFCQDEDLKTPVFDRDTAAKWVKPRTTEATTTHYSRVNATKHFLIWLHKRGYDVFITADVRFRPTDFKPHIYTENEIDRYFKAVDDLCSAQSSTQAIELPVVTRLMYCCGMRIGEVMHIRKKDVDFENRQIVLDNTKNGEDRLIVLADDMCGLLKQYSWKCFHALNNDSYIFDVSNTRKNAIRRVYDAHRVVMRKAGIPYLGEGEGPRVHDWRHTMATRSFKQLADAGYDMYTALPILSVYLGHKSIAATERYLQLCADIFPDIEKKLKLFEKTLGALDE